MARVLIIGTSTPIGRAITQRFVEAGHRVVGTALEPADNPLLVEEFIADCSTASGATDAVNGAVEQLGGLDVLVGAAGRQPTGRLEEITDEDWKAAFSGSTDTLFFPVRAALPHLQPGAAIVAVSSVNASHPAPWVVPYAASKAALEGLVRSLAVDLGARGVRVNAVAPGRVDGKIGVREAPGYPMGRSIFAHEVAAAVEFLASDAASGINGVVLPVDGGLSIMSPATFARPDLLGRIFPDA